MSKKKKKFSRIWCNQTELGKLFGLSSIKIGKILTELGYKDGAGVTQVAVDAGLAQFTPLKDGTAFWMWHKKKTADKIAAAGYERLDRSTVKENSIDSEARAIISQSKKMLDEGQDKMGYLLLFDGAESKEVQDRVNQLWEEQNT